MSHNVDTMAYAGEVPWHGLGVKVDNNLSPDAMMKAAGLDWTVKALSARATWKDKDGKSINIALPTKALIRETDGQLLTVITNKWNPVQNHEAFAFFKEFVDAGEMEMHTAGSLRDGQIVWVLAKVNESFEVLGKKDKVDSYLLFTNPHKYGKRMSVRSTQIRVVCNNTLTYAHNSRSDMIINFDHRVKFDAERVKQALNISREQRNEFKAAAEFLAKTKAKADDVKSFFETIIPSKAAAAAEGEEKKDPKAVTQLLDILDKQPGADFARGTWWNAFNAVTYMFDHVQGGKQDVRIDSAWYGFGAKKKNEALATAVKMAKAA